MATGLPVFTYVALGPDGKKRKGRLPAEDRASAIAALQGEGLIPIDVNEFKRGLGNIDLIKPKEERELKLKGPAVAILARQLYLLVRAGLSVPRAMLTIGEDHPDIRYTRMCTDISERVLAGVPLSKAMAEYPKCFDEIFCAYVQAGEVSGSLEESLYRLSRMLDKGNQLRLKVKAVTAYPKLVSMMVAALVVGIIMFLVPMYGRIYDGFCKPLPGPTRALMGLSDQYMTPINIAMGSTSTAPRELEPAPKCAILKPDTYSYAESVFAERYADGSKAPVLDARMVAFSVGDTWIYLNWFPSGFSWDGPFDWSLPVVTEPFNFTSPLVFLPLLWFGWRVFRRRTADNLQLGAKIDQFRYRAPLMGKLWHYTMLYRWSATLSGALGAGLQLHNALDLAGRTSGSKWMMLATEEFKVAVRAGRPLSREMARFPGLFNPQIRAMAVTGEEAGEPAEMFGNVAFTLEDELDALVAVLGARIEVALLAVMGVVIGSLLVVLYLPILNLSTAASEGYSDQGGSTP